MLAEWGKTFCAVFYGEGVEGRWGTYDVALAMVNEWGMFGGRGFGWSICCWDVDVFYKGATYRGIL